MPTLQESAQRLLESGAVQVVIGHAAGSTPERTRPVFIRQPADAAQLVWNEHCRQNLAVYLMKPEIKALGKAAVVASPTTLRTLLQYGVENQLAADAVRALAVSDKGEVVELGTLAEVEQHVAQLPHGLAEAERAELAKLDALTREQRWEFWYGELARCVKCYACRAACPLCYCTKCITENNQPQWVPVASDPLGNLEWNVVRAMHLAGRCVNCGSCAEACPAGIRIDLLNHVLAEEARTQFGAEAGAGLRKDYALAAFKPEDKESFIR